MRFPRPAHAVLLVDDHPAVLSSLKRMLSDQFWVHTASNAHEAFLLLLEHQNLYAVITDLEMPGRDGIWLLEQVRRYQPQAIRILSSGTVHDTPPDPELVQVCLPKPANLSDLLSSLAAEQDEDELDVTID